MVSLDLEILRKKSFLTVCVGNMVIILLVKIVLRGAGGVGKTSLFEVFQGRSCPEEYKPSQQIITTNVLWTNPISKERVKVCVFSCTQAIRLKYGM